MKLNLKKSQLVNLSLDNQALPNELTPQIAGGNCTCGCCTPSTPAAGCGGGGTGTGGGLMTANEQGCPSDPFGWTNICCMIP